MTIARHLQTGSLSNQNISSALAVGSYTADADRMVVVQVLADQVAGNGDYEFYLTLRVNGAGSHYRLIPVTSAAAASGLTAVGAQSGMVAVRSGDVLTVYLKGLAGDNATPDTIVRWFEVDALQPATAGRTLAVDANGYAAADLKLWRGFAPNGLSSAGDVLTLVTEIDNPAMQNVADALLLAPSGPAASGSAMDVLADILEDTGTTIPAAIAGIGGLAGSGAISFPITVQDEDSNPIDGVEVWVTTDSAGTNVVAGTLSTDALGLATFMLDAGTYYVWRQKSGYNFTNPVTITVS